MSAEDPLRERLSQRFQPSRITELAGQAVRPMLGRPGDWDPPNSSLIMSESGGVYTYTANNLVDGTLYEFKVLDDEGTPPANWGDPEIVPRRVLLLYDETTVADRAETVGHMKGVVMKAGQMLSFILDGLPDNARSVLDRRPRAEGP